MLPEWSFLWSESVTLGSVCFG